MNLKFSNPSKSVRCTVRDIIAMIERAPEVKISGVTMGVIHKKNLIKRIEKKYSNI